IRASLEIAQKPRSHRHRPLGGDAAGDVAGDGGQLVHAVVVAEHVVVLQRRLGQVADALVIAIGGVDLVADVLGQGHLRGGRRAPPAGGVGHAVVHLEVDVGPAARVGGGEDAGEGDHAVAVGLLHTPQVVLAFDARRVQRVAALPVAVPQVDGAAPGLAAPALLQQQADGEGPAGGGGGRRAEAGGDVAAHHAVLGEDVRPVGAVARGGAGGLLGDGVGGPGGGGRRARA